MNLFVRSLALLACGVVLAPRLLAEDGGIQFPSFNPFASRDESDQPQRPTSDENSDTGGFSWPTLPKPKLPTLPRPTLPKLGLPSWGSSDDSPARRTSNEPSMWEKVNSGTKNLFTKTKQTLMPWTADDSKSARSSGARRPTRTSSRPKSKSNKKSILSSWLSQGEEEKPIQTVNDYLSLPRVPFE
jgi:hypothetical protein